MPEEIKPQNSKRSTRGAHLAPYRFKPGMSGNPGGRPKHDIAKEIAQAVFEGNIEKIYEAMGKALLKGNPKVFTALADRAYDKPPQTHGGSDELPPIRVVVEHSGNQDKVST